MANISALLEIIRTAHLGRDMRQALHDAIETVNNDTENALGKSLTFVTATRKLSLKAKDGSTLSEVVIPGGSGSGSVNSVNNVQPDADGNVTVNLADINDVNLNSPSSGQVLKYDGEKWINGGGGGGTSDYSDLTNKPQINGVTLSGNKTASELGVKVNDNLISNGWFTVNTNGFSSTSSDNVDTVNKWKTSSLNGGGVAVNVDGGLTLTSESTSNSYLYQMIDNYAKMLDGKTITISLNVDGTIYSDTKTISDVTSSYYKWWTMSNGAQIGYLLQGQDKFVYILWKSDSSTSKSVNVKSIKLEYGSISTLAYDHEPNYELESVKCGNGATKQDITSIVATGTTNNSGNTISNGSLFYLNGTLCKALSNIASGSAFTLNTNYKVNNLNNEIKAKYIDYVYENATTSGTQYIISNAKSTVFGLSSGNIIYGLAPRRATGNEAMGILQLAYDATNDKLIFVSTANNSNYTVLQFVVLYV